MVTQTMAPNIPGLQGLNRHPHKHIFYPSDYYDGSNIIRLPWSGTQVE